MAEETKIIYHVDDEETPYLVKIPKPPDEVTLGDFKNVINRPNYKFFFKSMDDDFGVVKEEIVDEDAPLPCFNGRVVSWVVPPDEGSNDGHSVHSGENGFPSSVNVTRSGTVRTTSKERSADVTDAESIASKRSSRSRASRRYESEGERRPRRSHRENRSEYDAQSMMSSDLEATSFIDSDEESQMSSATESSRFVGGRQRRRRRKQRMPRVERCSSFSTITESTMSLNIITVTLNMDKINFLGISIVGQANKKGDGGIYVGSVMKGGAVDADGRIEPGDMILAVGDVNFENMSNDDAVRVLRECVHKPGPITLTVAKCWDPSPKGYFTVPKNDVTRPIDPAAWLQHSEAVRATGGLLGRSSGSPSMSTMTSTSESLTSSIPEADRYLDHPDLDLGLSINTDMHTVVKVMSSADSGLVVRDRMWLKVTIPHAFMGSDLVDWLFAHVDGFVDRRDARKYASKLLKAGLIRHAVNKISFSEQCYYVFGDLNNRMNNLSIQDIEGSEEDTLAPLATSSNQQPLGTWTGQPQPMYIQPGMMPMMQQHLMTASMVSGSGGEDPPPTYAQVFPQGTFGQFPFFTSQPGPLVANPAMSTHMSGGSGSNHSGSHKSGTVKSNNTIDPDQVTIRSSDSDRSHSSKGSKRDNMSIAEKTSIAYTTDIASLRNEPMAGSSAHGNAHGSQTFMIPTDPQQRELGRLDSMPASLSASRQSFRMAMGNTSNEFFVDVM